MKTAILKLIKKANLDHEHCISLIGGGGKTTLVFEPVSYTHLDVYKRQPCDNK